MWALAAEVRRAAEIVLESPQFDYLKNMFKDRPIPTASRLHYAIASVEDAIVSAAEDALALAVPSAKIMTYMFDGAVVKVKAVHCCPRRHNEGSRHGQACCLQHEAVSAGVRRGVNPSA